MGGQCALQVQRVHPSRGCVATSTAHRPWSISQASLAMAWHGLAWHEVTLSQEVLEPPHSLQGGGSGRAPGDGGGVVEVAEEEEVPIAPSSWGMTGSRESRTPTPWCRVSALHSLGAGGRVVILRLPAPPGAGGAEVAGVEGRGEGGPTGAVGEGSEGGGGVVGAPAGVEGGAGAGLPAWWRAARWRSLSLLAGPLWRGRWGGVGGEGGEEGGERGKGESGWPRRRL